MACVCWTTIDNSSEEGENTNQNFTQSSRPELKPSNIRWYSPFAWPVINWMTSMINLRLYNPNCHFDRPTWHSNISPAVCVLGYWGCFRQHIACRNTEFAKGVRNIPTFWYSKMLEKRQIEVPIGTNSTISNKPKVVHWEDTITVNVGYRS